MTTAAVEQKRPYPFDKAETEVRRTPSLQTVLVIIGGLKHADVATVTQILQEDITAATFSNNDRALRRLATEDGYVAIAALPISSGDITLRLPAIIDRLRTMGLITVEEDSLRLTAPNGETLYGKLTTPDRVRAQALANEADELLTR